MEFLNAHISFHHKHKKIFIINLNLNYFLTSVDGLNDGLVRYFTPESQNY